MTVDIKEGADLPELSADKIQLAQVIINLILNAADALEQITGERTVTIQTGLTGANQDEILVSISDNGPGIAAEPATQVFDQFFTTKSDGLGMGLAISKSIVENHGGRLRVAKTSSTGTTFELTLPYT